MKRLIGMAVAIVLVAPTQASDFSKLAEPAFGRSMLISAVRERQKECAGLALYWAEHGKAPGKEGARRLADAVAARLTIEIGDAVLARSLVEGKAAGYADPTKTEPFWTEVRDYLTQKCEPYFEAARKGDSELAVALGPMPTELLQLPSEEQCLATADYAQGNRPRPLGRGSGRTAAERALRQCRRKGACGAAGDRRRRHQGSS